MAVGDAENEIGDGEHMRSNQNDVNLCLVAIMWPGLAVCPFVWREKSGMSWLSA